MDLHLGRTGDSSDWHCFFLDGLRFPRRGDLSLRCRSTACDSEAESRPTIFSRARIFQDGLFLGVRQRLEDMAFRRHLHGRYTANILPLWTVTLRNVFLADVPLYAFSLFLPSIIAALGYKSTEAQLLSVPPYAAAAILTITVGCKLIFDKFWIECTSTDSAKTLPIELANEVSATSSPLCSPWSASPCS